jgi:hypothetical protein
MVDAVHGGNMRDDCLCNGGFLGAGIYEPGVEASLANAALVLVVGTLFQILTNLILRGTRVYTRLDHEYCLFWIAVGCWVFSVLPLANACDKVKIEPSH